jgi:hypothetical protein
VRVRLGTPFQAGVVQQSRIAGRPCQGRDDGATPFTRSIFGDVAHQQSARLTCERQRRAALLVPTIFEGIAQPARADASHASGQRCNSFCPHHFLSLWCSPANMPASHAGDHRSEAGQGRHSLGAWLTGNSRPTWLRTRQPWTCKSSRADHFRCPQSIVSDASAR